MDAPSPSFAVRALRLVRAHIPEILAGVAALSLSLFAPMRIWDDGTQFESLSRSILRGEYALEPGIPSMYREPVYPLFRAAVYAVGGTPHVVLVLQAILVVLTALVWRRVWERIRPGSGWIGAWGTATAYGYWLFARMHAYEVLIGLLLALGILGFQSLLRERRWTFGLGAGIALGLLSATRGVYLFFPFFLLGFAAVSTWPALKDERPRRLLAGLTIFLAAASAIPGAWMLRNGLTFGTYGLASRPGLVLLARGLKVDASWSRLAASAVGTLTGDALLKVAAPGLEPITSQHYRTLDLEREESRARLGIAMTDQRVDDDLMAKAKARIFGSPERFMKYALWTPVDMARLVSLPSFTTPWGSMEPMFATAAALGIAKVAALLAAAGLNLVWIFGGLLGLAVGWRRFRWAAIPGAPYLYLLGIHSPIDNVVRFSASIQPIIGAFVVLTGLALWGQAKKRLQKTA